MMWEHFTFQWCITDSPPDVDSIHSLLIGILLDPVESISVMEKGPSAETPEVLMLMLEAFCIEA